MSRDIGARQRGGLDIGARQAVSGAPPAITLQLPAEDVTLAPVAFVLNVAAPPGITLQLPPVDATLAPVEFLLNRQEVIQITPPAAMSLNAVPFFLNVGGAPIAIVLPPAIVTLSPVAPLINRQVIVELPTALVTLTPVAFVLSRQELIVLPVETVTLTPIAFSLLLNIQPQLPPATMALVPVAPALLVPFNPQLPPVTTTLQPIAFVNNVTLLTDLQFHTVGRDSTPVVFDSITDITRVLVTNIDNEGNPAEVAVAPVDDNVETFDDTFVQLDSPRLLTLVPQLDGHRATDLVMINDGPGEFSIATSRGGTVFGGEHRLLSGETYTLTDIAVHTLRLTWIADSAYRIAYI